VHRSCTDAPLQMMLFWMWLPSPMLMLSMSTQLITFTLLPSLQQQQQQHGNRQQPKHVVTLISSVKGRVRAMRVTRMNVHCNQQHAQVKGEFTRGL
jgi:3'-phosphoadenosine 5'-phosphosulfate sulfotransferase